MKIEQIISGGQTGVDQAALRAAYALGVRTGGWMPNGWRTDEGPRPDIGKLYDMDEHKSAEYAPRTIRNVQESDATLILGNKQSSGCALTIRACAENGKPYFVQDFQVRGASCHAIVEWLDGLKLEETRDSVWQNRCCLNVAGNRERKYPGIGEWAEDVVRMLLQRRKL